MTFRAAPIAVAKEDICIQTSALPYFRQAAVDANKHQRISPFKTAGSLGWLLTALFAGIMVTAVAFLASARYARRETVSGQIVPKAGAIRVNPAIAGIAERILVKEGEFVRAGQTIALVASHQALKSGRNLERELKSVQELQRQALQRQTRARLQQIGEQVEELARRRDGLLADVGRCADLERLLGRRLALQRDTYAAQKSLADKGMISAASLRQQEDAVLSLQQQGEQARRDRALQQNQIDQITHQLRRLNADAELARSEADSARGDLLAHQLNSDAQLAASVVAPLAGYVTAISAHEGANVTVDQTIAVIVPAAGKADEVALEAELWAPSRAIGFVKPGARVRLMYDAFPFHTFGAAAGTVVDVAGSPLLPKEIPLPLEPREALFRVRVAVQRGKLDAYGQQWPLAPGMRLNADLVLEERSLLDLLFEPVRVAGKRFLD